MKEKNEEERINKVKVGFFLTKNIVDSLRNLIQIKYKNYSKGLLSYEAELALRHWIGLHTQAQNAFDRVTGVKPNPTPKVILTFAEVKNYLLTYYYEELNPGHKVPYKHLEEAISNTRGTDPRTIRKWLKAFHRNGLIKPVTSTLWEICGPEHLEVSPQAPKAGVPNRGPKQGTVSSMRGARN